MLSETKLTSASHFIVGGLKENEGIVISRHANHIVHQYELSATNWFILMTNVDTWIENDARFIQAEKLIEKIG